MANIAMIAANDFEDAELAIPLEKLEEYGHKVTIIGTEPGKTLTGKRHQERVSVELATSKARVQDFDLLVIPGGYSPDKLRLDKNAVAFVRDFTQSGKPVAAICHAAQLLISAGVVEGKTLTCWPSIAIDVQNAGGNYIDEPLVIDGNLITSRKPSDIPQFIDAILNSLQTLKKAA